MSNRFVQNNRRPYNPLQANKGRALEDIVKYQNQLYAGRGICNVQKISTPWKVIWGGNKVVGAFPEEKSTLDFRGTVKGGIPISFDTKESEEERGLPLKYIAEHQIDYIRDALSLGEVSFIICKIKPLEAYMVIPGQIVLQAWDNWKANKGKRGYNIITIDHMLPIERTHPGNVLDYLPVALGGYTG